MEFTFFQGRQTDTSSGLMSSPRYSALLLHSQYQSVLVLFHLPWIIWQRSLSLKFRSIIQKTKSESECILRLIVTPVCISN